MSLLEICARILLAMAIGGIIGWERENSNRPAGLRTHMLVAIGAAVVMLMGELSLETYADITTMDPTRLGAQVISGIGFLGAGTIMKEGATVKGLTTAASLWAVACLGLAAGGGFYEAATAGTIAIIITLTIFEYLEKRFCKVRQKGLAMDMVCTDISSTLINIKKIAPGYDVVLNDVDIAEEIGEDRVLYHVTSKFGFGKSSKKVDKDGFTSEIKRLDGVSVTKVKDL
ncbi:MgtC/SapB family protein [Anoxybacterium hadale]|uniref:MgtC/SapB family protein n=1 Tax=Anoxybacterium hadale TaxID=3408580 RepID=A0ACD1AE50_9FIRM|nr:MgtC/SapB family protein [Clostridiales bacterium]